MSAAISHGHLARRLRRYASVAAAASLLFIACKSTTDVKPVTLSFQGDTTLVVGRTLIPRITVSIDNVPVERALLQFESTDPSVFTVALHGDSLVPKRRGRAGLRIRLIASTLGDTPPDTTVNLRVVADRVVLDRQAHTFVSLGDSLGVTAFALGARGDTLPNSPASWFTTDSAVVAVNPAGFIKAVANGTAFVRGVIDDDTASVRTTVAQVLTDYRITPDPVILASLGASDTMVAVPLDAGGSVIPAGAPAASWQAANPAVATVGPAGITRAVDNGETYVRAVSGSVRDSVRVEVRQVASQVDIFGPRIVNLAALNDTVKLNGAAFDGLNVSLIQPNFRWVSRNVRVAQVGPGGVVTALDVGSAVIHASVDTASDSITVVITNVPTGLQILPDSMTFSSVNDTSVAVATIRNKFGAVLPTETVTWRIIDATVADVLPNGSVFAKAIGTTRLVGTVVGASSVVDTIPVVVNNQPETVDIIPTSLTLASLGDTVSPAIQIRNARGDALPRASVAWTVLDAAVVSVNGVGLVTAIGGGQTYVRATNPLSAARRDSVLLIVTNAPDTVEVNRTLDSLTAPTLTLQYSAIVRNAARDQIPGALVRWVSRDPNVATVASGGLATSQAAGSTWIVAEVGSGAGLRADSARLVVTNDVISLTLSATTVNIASVGFTQTLSATARNSVGGVVSNVQVGWTSQNTAVARVDSTGVVLGIGEGTTQVTAALGTLAASATVNVTNRPDSIDIVPDSLVLASVLDTLTPPTGLLNGVGDSLGLGSATWSTDDAAVAAVSTVGRIQAIGIGGTYVRARNGIIPSITDSVFVTVTNAPDSLALAGAATDTLSSLGRTKQYAATIWNARRNIITTSTPVWASTNGAIASITQTGLATAVSVGTTQIIATAGAVADTATLVVENKAVTITVSPSPVTLNSVNDTIRLQITVRNEQGSVINNPLATWSHSNAGVATVDPAGLVTARGPGSSTVDVTVDAVTVATGVSVNNNPTSIVFNQTALTFPSVGDTATAQVTITNALGAALPRTSAAWTSSDGNKVTVSSSGRLTAIAAGDSIVITASSPVDNTVTDTMYVTVTNDPVTLTLNTTNNTLTALGSTLNYTAQVRNLAGNLIPGAPVTWTSSQNPVATVDVNGTATAVATGLTTITADAGTGALANATLTVTNNAISISVTPPSASILNLNGNVQLTASTQNDRGNPLPDSNVTWTSLSSAPVVTTVNGLGLVNAAGVTGVDTIIATAAGGLADTSVVTVADQADTVRFAPPKLDTLGSVGDTVHLYPNLITITNNVGTTLPATSVTWSSNNTQIASVTNGIVTAAGKGTAVITATSPFNATKTDNMTIVVTNAPASVSLNQNTVNLTSLTETRQLNATVQNGRGANLTGVTVVWQTRAAGIASVNQSGLVTGVATGVTRVIAWADSLNSLVADSATVNVSNVVTTVTVNPNNVAIDAVQDSAVVGVTAQNALGGAVAGAAITWSSSPADSAVVRILQGGGVTPSSDTLLALAVGTATVTARVNGIAANVAVTVTDELNTIVFDSATITLVSLTETRQVTGTFENALGSPVPRTVATWTTGDPTRVTVDTDGRITGIAVTGSPVWVRAFSPTNNNIRDSVAVSVSDVPANVVLSSTLDTLLATGQSYTLSAQVTNALGGVISGPPVNWSTNAAAVANISPTSGLSTTVTAGGTLGQALVTATSGALSATDTVRRAAPTTVYVSGDSSTSREFGTRKDPFKTIQLGITNVSNTGTVVVEPSGATYQQTGANLTINKSLTLLGDSSAACPGACTSRGDPAVGNLPLFTQSVSGPVIEVNTAGAVNIRWMRVNQTQDGAAIRLNNSNVTGTIDYVFVNEGAGAVTFGSGILAASATAVTIRRSRVRAVRYYGIRVNNIAPTIEDSDVYWVGTAAGDSAGAGIDIMGSTGTIVRRTRVERTTGPRIRARAETNLTLENDTLLGRAQLASLTGVTGVNALTGNVFNANLVLGDDGNGSAVDGRSALELTGGSTGFTLNNNVFLESGAVMDFIRMDAVASIGLNGGTLTNGRNQIIADNTTLTTAGLATSGGLRSVHLTGGTALTSTGDGFGGATSACIAADRSLTAAANTLSFSGGSMSGCATSITLNDQGAVLALDGTTVTGSDQVIAVTNADSIGLTGGSITGTGATAGNAAINLPVSATAAAVTIDNTAFSALQVGIVNMAEGDSLRLSGVTINGNDVISGSPAITVSAPGAPLTLEQSTFVNMGLGVVNYLVPNGTITVDSVMIGGSATGTADVIVINAAGVTANIDSVGFVNISRTAVKFEDGARLNMVNDSIAGAGAPLSPALVVTAANAIVEIDSLHMRGYGAGLITLTQADSLHIGRSTFVGTGGATGSPAITIGASPGALGVSIDNSLFASFADNLVRMADGDTLGITNVSATGGASGVPAISVLASAADAKVAIRGSQFLNTPGGLINMNSSGATSTLAIDRVTVTGTGGGSGDIIVVSDANATVVIDSTGITGIDRRVVNFVGSSLTMTRDTIVGTGGVGGVEQVVSAGGTTVTMDSVIITDFPGRVGVGASAATSFSLVRSRIARNDVGVDLAGVPATRTLADNDIYDNVTAGGRDLPNDNALAANWWGDSDGPRRHNGGVMDPAAGDTLTFLAAIDTATFYAGVQATPNDVNGVGGVVALVRVRGHGESAPASSFLPTVLAVRAVDARGRPVQNVMVTFTSPDPGHDFIPGGGNQNQVTVATDASGLAEVPLEFDGTTATFDIAVTAPGTAGTIITVTAT